MNISHADLQGKTALITGATNGMGKEATIALAMVGTEVVLIDRTTRDRPDPHFAWGKASRRLYAIAAG